MEAFRSVAEYASSAIDLAGVAVIVLWLFYAFVRFLRPVATPPGRYGQLRQDLGRGILLGLELMVAADIIRTVGVDPTLESVLVLGGIVLIRTFLSMSLEVELEGRLPWRKRRETGDTGATI